jgi:hypothetical protein
MCQAVAWQEINGVNRDGQVPEKFTWKGVASGISCVRVTSHSACISDMEFSCTSEVQTFLYIGRETFTSVLSHTRVRLGRDLCEILGSGKPPDRKKKKKKLSHARSDAQPCVVQQDLCRPL